MINLREALFHCGLAEFVDKPSKAKYDIVRCKCGSFASGMQERVCMLDAVLDALLDTVKLVPFLFLAYIIMEYLEHKTGQGTQRLIRKAGRFGPVIGGALGIVPQCGFSAAASNLYAGRMITLGTLMAVYLSTSDEMLPILISEHAPAEVILKLLLTKAVIGCLAGVALDFLLRKRRREEHGHIRDICEHERCHCEQGIFRSALTHTAKISLFVFLTGLVLNIILYFAGDEALSNMLLNHTILGPVLAGLVGLIPSCAGSVAITRLYLQGALETGGAMAGLLTGSGVGLLVLFRVNHDRKESLSILCLLYGIGVLAGILAGLVEI